MNDNRERGSLEGPPPSMEPQAGASDGSQSGSAGPSPAGSASPSQGTSAASFDFNQPTIISVLYLASFLTGVTAIVGIVLAYVWKGDPKAEWEVSHYQYLINTFWIGLVGGFISVVLMIVLIGFLLLPAVMVLVVVRSVLSLINAQKQQPMPNPGTLLA